MGSRLDLHEKLCSTLGSRNVYFQPPESIKMKYPAIRYKLARITNVNANNKTYNQRVGYEVMVIDSDPDSEIAKSISKFRYTSFDRHYSSDNLNHYVFTIFY